jgi:hypothetical protein
MFVIGFKSYLAKKRILVKIFDFDAMLTIIKDQECLEIEIASADFSAECNYYEAIEYCKEMGEGWRLPTEFELVAMYEQLHKSGSGNFVENGYYWSSKHSAERARVRCFNSNIHVDYISLIEEPALARAVKNR